MTTNRGEDEFREFMADAEPRLRRSLVAAYGPERGREAAAEALAYGWEHWNRVRRMGSPVAYLYRVGQSRTRPRKVRTLIERHPVSEVWCEPGLPSALAALSERQRVVVVLVHGFGWSLTEVGDLTGLRKTTIQNHLERAMTSLRAHLEVSAPFAAIPARPARGCGGVCRGGCGRRGRGRRDPRRGIKRVVHTGSVCAAGIRVGSGRRVGGPDPTEREHESVPQVGRTLQRGHADVLAP